MSIRARSTIGRAGFRDSLTTMNRQLGNELGVFNQRAGPGYTEDQIATRTALAASRPCPWRFKKRLSQKESSSDALLASSRGVRRLRHVDVELQCQRDTTSDGAELPELVPLGTR